MDVEDLVKLGFSNKEILCLLAHQHAVIISKRTLQRLCRKLNLFLKLRFYFLFLYGTKTPSYIRAEQVKIK